MSYEDDKSKLPSGYRCPSEIYDSGGSQFARPDSGASKSPANKITVPDSSPATADDEAEEKEQEYRMHLANAKGICMYFDDFCDMFKNANAGLPKEAQFKATKMVKMSSQNTPIVDEEEYGFFKGVLA